MSRRGAPPSEHHSGPARGALRARCTSAARPPRPARPAHCVQYAALAAQPSVAVTAATATLSPQQLTYCFTCPK